MEILVNYRMDLMQWQVSKIRHETRHAASIFLKKADNTVFTYQAGQFLTFIFTFHSGEVRRSYSFSSTPGVDEEIFITVQRVPNGQISRMLLEHLEPGRILYSLPPAGRFTLPTHPTFNRQIFFIAAGIGITPIFSLLKKLLVEEPLTAVVLIDQNHTERMVIFNRQLSELADQFPNRFKWISLLSNPRDLHSRSERLNNELLQQLIEINWADKSETLFYCCGPSAFMRMCQFTLRVLGFSEDQIRKENFIVEYIPPAPLVTDTSIKKVRITLNGQSHEFNIQYPMNILQAALNNNIQIPYSCRGGRCSSCVARCISGKVIMSINEVLTEQDLQENLVLTCVGYAVTDLQLEI